MVSNDSASFSLEEIKAQLAALGYGDVGEDRLEQFHTDISQLMSVGDNQDYPKMYDYDLQTTGDSFLDLTDATEYISLPKIRPKQDGDQSDSDASSIVSTSSSSISESFFRRAPVSKITRKVLRKSNDGESFVSVIESVRPNDSIVSIERNNADNFDTQSLMSISTIDSELRDRLDRLKINIRNQNDENERPQTAIKKISKVRFDDNHDHTPIYTRPQTAPAAPRNERYWDGEKGSNAPAFLKPHFKTGRKDGPVELFQKYRDDWGKFKLPTGEWNRERQAVRKIMSQKDPEPVLPRRKITSEYVVPTTKKRRALAWEVRTALHERRPINN